MSPHPPPASPSPMWCSALSSSSPASEAGSIMPGGGQPPCMPPRVLLASCKNMKGSVECGLHCQSLCRTLWSPAHLPLPDAKSAMPASPLLIGCNSGCHHPCKAPPKVETTRHGPRTWKWRRPYPSGGSETVWLTNLWECNGAHVPPSFLCARLEVCSSVSILSSLRVCGLD